VVFSNLQALQGERVLTLENVEEHLRFWLLQSHNWLDRLIVFHWRVHIHSLTDWWSFNSLVLDFFLSKISISCKSSRKDIHIKSHRSFLLGNQGDSLTGNVSNSPTFPDLRLDAPKVNYASNPDISDAPFCFFFLKEFFPFFVSLFLSAMKLAEVYVHKCLTRLAQGEIVRWQMAMAYATWEVILGQYLCAT
jgi:hypothetical protein